MLAVDVDGPEGDAVIQDFERRGCHFPKTMIFRSPEKADHYKYLYKAPPGITFKQANGWASDGIHKAKIDLKAWHSLVVAGGSVVHQCGLPTITENEMPFSDLPEAPEWLCDLLLAQKHIKTPAELEAAEKRRGIERHTGWHDDGGEVNHWEL